MSSMKKPIVIQTGNVALILGLIAALLVMASIICQIIQFEKNIESSEILRLFNVNKEGNIPTVFSGLILFISAVLLGIIAWSKKRQKELYAGHWKALSFIFLYLAADEAGRIHEITIEPLRDLFNTKGFLYFAWVIPGIVLLIIFIFSYWNFFLHLKTRFRLLFSLAGILYVTGVLGSELVGGQYIWTGGGTSTFTYTFIVTMEESLEMVGIIVFIYALLKYASLNVKEVRFLFRESG